MAMKTKHIAILGVIALAAGTLASFFLSKKESKAQVTGAPSSPSSPSIFGIITKPPKDTPVTPPVVITGTPALTSGQALTIANNLLDAMDRYGTDEQAIIDNFSRCKTKADLLLVIEKFGTHKYLMVGTIFGLGKEKNLMEWLKADLNKSELAAVKSNVFDKFNVPL
jgi:hypothetical protein